MIALVLCAQLVAAPTPALTDSIPIVTLAEALERGTRLNPDYVRALGQVDEAEWGSRAARLAFIIPAITASVDITKYSTSFFNIGTGTLQSTSVVGTLDASYELFSGQKIARLGQTRAELEASQAGELQSRFAAAVLTESAYYDVLASQELLRVARERVDRADEQLGVARARVLSGAAVQSDSLQLRLELTRARVSLLQQESGLRVTRLQLGRRVGLSGPVDAAPLDTLPAPPLRLSLPEALSRALDHGPTYQAASARERAANSVLQGQRGRYLPVVTLSGQHVRFDSKFFPSARNVSSVTLDFRLPIWDRGDREIAITQARANRDVARAVRADLERAAARDVTLAYDTYETGRASTALTLEGLGVARENYRVQEVRYRGGATTILDLLQAQAALSQAQADVVQARYVNRLALAGLEAILGERLFPNGEPQ